MQKKPLKHLEWTKLEDFNKKKNLFMKDTTNS